jgi:hypothetical protein
MIHTPHHITIIWLLLHAKFALASCINCLYWRTGGIRRHMLVHPMMLVSYYCAVWEMLGEKVVFQVHHQSEDHIAR